MIAAPSLPDSPATIPIRPAPPPDDLDRHGFRHDEPVTLRAFYERVMLPVIAVDQSAGSLKEDRTSLNHWDRLFAEIDIREVTSRHIAALRDDLVARMKPASVNKYWREIASIFRWAVTCEDPYLDSVPRLHPRRATRLVNEGPKRQREPMTESELSSLWRACRFASYPKQHTHPAPKLWRVALVLFWTYGPRTRDLLRKLTWSDVRLESRRIVFEAMKTRKIQGLPLTETVIAHLDSIRGRAERVFPGFNSTGCRLRKGTWKRGYYATWNSEIVANAGAGDLQIKHLREAMVTRYNGIEPNLGSWIAGHFVPGVSAVSYDLPTRRIREAIESAPVPECFHEIG